MNKVRLGGLCEVVLQEKIVHRKSYLLKGQNLVVSHVC